MKTQHTQPCKQCPWRRKAAPKWLGGFSIQHFLSAAHSDVVYPCHCASKLQCAGMAIYRANVCKAPRGPMLDLPRDKGNVFASPFEFSAHHGAKECPQVLPYGMLDASEK